MDKQDVAKDLYIYANLNGKQIAEKMGVTENTVANWKNKNGWETTKEEYESIPKMRFQILINAYRRAKEMSETNFDADELSKITSAIDRLEKKIPNAYFEQVGQQFIIFIYDTEPLLTAELVQNLYSKFILHLTGGQTNETNRPAEITG